MYQPNDYFAKARQDQLLREAGAGQGAPVEAGSVFRLLYQGFLRRLVGGLFRRKTRPALDLTGPGVEKREALEV